MADKKIRVLMAKKRIDVHGRGTKLISKVLMDAGMEVIYFRFGTPDEIFNAAMQEDVDVIGVSIMTGGHFFVADKLMGMLKEKGVDDVLVIMGGLIPGADTEKLLEMGIDEVFQPGLPGEVVVNYIEKNLKRKAA